MYLLLWGDYSRRVTIQGNMVQWNLVNTNTVNTNFRLIRTNIYRNSGPCNDFSIDITSVNTNSG